MNRLDSKKPAARWIAGCLGVILAAGVAQGEFRSFKSAKGDNTIIAELMASMGSGRVKIKKDDGKEIVVPIKAFSADDQAYIENWVKTHPNAVNYQFVVDLKEVKTDTKRTKDYSDEITIDTVGYEVNISNRARATVEGLTVKYKVFMENRVSEYGSFLREPGVKYKEGEAKLPPMAYNKSARLMTKTMKTRRVRTRFSYNGRAHERDRMKGVWLQFYKGDTLVHEWKAEEVPVSEWDFAKKGKDDDEEEAIAVPGFGGR